MVSTLAGSISMENRERSSFVQSRLPWIIAAAALVLYLITLNRWVSLASLPVVSGITDPDALPPLNGPLHFLVTYPFRWLPPGVQLIGLNLFAALCAALTLALLARSVALLPHDRTREQRQRERSELSLLSIPAAWAPPLFAALVCGLQLSFWEHATAATGEMLDLLLFAYLIRCLLEYRIDQRECWLTRLALVYGITTTNNYALIAYFPGFLAALIWIKGKSFFEFRFLTRMLGWGAAGLALYLLLPVVSALNENSGTDFWTSLRLELAGQKGALRVIPSLPRDLMLPVALISLLPVLVIAIRWPSSFGDMSAMGSIVTNAMFRVVHGMFFVAILCAAFDAPFSPRARMDKLIHQSEEITSGVPMLGLYYLSALCVGYLAGYYLLVFGTDLEKKWQRATGAMRLLNHCVTVTVWITIVGIPIGLLWKNSPLVRASDGTVLRDFARTITERLPHRNAVVLCDQPYILLLVQNALNQSGHASENLLVDTRLLPLPVYQRTLHERSPKRWPEIPDAPGRRSVLDSSFLIYQLTEISLAGDTFYLHPSFGYYFEAMFIQPRGPIYELLPYATNAIAPPPLAPEIVEENRKFWSQSGATLDRLAALNGRDSYEARAVARWYSRSINYWGVELQKAGYLKEAHQCFEQSRKLNTENLAAETNLKVNEQIQAGVVKPMDPGKSVQDKFGPFGDWNRLLAVTGPIDEPGFCFRLGQTLAQQSLFRQAALQFLRVQQLDPANLENRFWLANMYVTGRLYDSALKVTQEIRTPQPGSKLATNDEVELARLEALAHFGKGEFEKAEKLLIDIRRQYPGSVPVLDTLAQIYFASNRLTNALTVLNAQLSLDPGNLRTLFAKTVILINMQDYTGAGEALDVILQKDPENVQAMLSRSLVCMKTHDYAQADTALDRILRKDPKNVQALLNRGALRIETKAYKAALQTLDKILEFQPGNEVALMNRAIANLQIDQLDAAKHDYETLLKSLPTEHRIFYGLGEIAYRQKDYQAYLKYAPSGTEEHKMVTDRLNELQKAGH